MSEGICLVTGATSGIGFVTAREIARQRFTVIIVGRSLERSEAAVNQIKEATGNARVDFLLADLSVQSEVRRLARKVLERVPVRSPLAENAGLGAVRPAEAAAYNGFIDSLIGSALGHTPRAPRR
jgi:short-subunit dehydrogenase